MFGELLARAHAQKITKIQDMALKNGCLIVGLFDAGGARIQAGVAAPPVAATARCSSAHNVLASGVSLPLSLSPTHTHTLTACAAATFDSPAMTDFIFTPLVRDTSYMFVAPAPTLSKRSPTRPATTAAEELWRRLGSRRSNRARSNRPDRACMTTT